MLRWILEELVLFALPFLAFAGVLLLLRRNPLQARHWEAQWLRLVLAGLFVVVASLLMTGLTASRHPDGYVPPHMENGRLVPGNSNEGVGSRCRCIKIRPPQERRRAVALADSRSQDESMPMAIDMIPAGLDADGPKRLLTRPSVVACLAVLRAEGEETRLVGGCVRDALLGQDAADIDLATTHRPASTMALARAAGLKAVPTGFDHGTVTLVVDGAPVEVTTLREDIETDGRHAVVRFGRDFGRDAERRDFTINALSLDAVGRLHDLTDGLADLDAGRVRFIGDPATRLREDALRALRFFRFHARFGRGEPDPAGLGAVIAARASLDRLSRERVRAETLKLLVAPRAVAAIAVMSETGLLNRVLGGVGDLGRLARAASDPGASAAARLAALGVRTVEDADRLRERLRLSKAEHAHLAGYAVALTDLHGRPAIEGRDVRGLAATHGLAMLAEVLRAVDGEPRPHIDDEARAVMAGLVASRERLALPLGGGDLIARGVRPGPAVGRSLAAARALWLSEGCPMDDVARERLIAHAVAAADEGDG